MAGYDEKDENLQGQYYDMLINNLGTYIEGITRSIDLLKPKKDDVFLEIGTGTGNYALSVAKMVKAVVATDFSDEMLSVARRKAQILRYTNIKFRRAGFMNLSSLDTQFNKVITNLSLHSLTDDDKYKAMENVFNVLEPGGRFVLGDIMYFFDSKDYLKNLNTLKFILSQCTGQNYFVKDLIEIMENEYPTYASKLTHMLHEAGFETICVEQDENFIFSGMILGIKGG